MARMGGTVEGEPIGRVEALGEAVDVLAEPIVERHVQRVLRSGDALRLALRFMAAGHHFLGTVIKLAQERSLPGVPPPRPDRADIGRGEDE